MFNKRYIGGRHTQENKLIKSKTQLISAEEKKEFQKEYKKIINEEFILRSKKRTGKSYDWHISLNPRKLEDLNDLLERDD